MCSLKWISLIAGLLLLVEYQTYIFTFIPRLVYNFSFYTVMLKWFVDEKTAETSIKNPNQLIEEEDVEVRPEKLPDAILDENVDVHLIRKFFSQDAWLLVTEVVKQKQDKPLYVCLYCLHDLGEAPSIVCDHCLSWCHLKCVGLKHEPKMKHWYCRSCHDSPLA